MPITLGSIYFVADVHWQPATSSNTAAPLGLFANFLDELSAQARRIGGIKLYVLGDLFEYWFEPRRKPFNFYTPHIQALARAHAAGVRLFLLAGNRDFAYGDSLKECVGATIVGDNTSLSLGSQRVWLEHGDLLCSRDLRYQLYRRIIRSRFIRALASLLTQTQLTRLITWMRRASTAEIQRKNPAALTVVDRTVTARLTRGFDIVMCGHVHQPSRRIINSTKHPGELITLGSWESDTGWYACWHDKLELKRYTR